MMQRSLIVAAILVALVGCSDLEPDLATCKAKVAEADARENMSGDEAAGYLRECMRAEGWPLRDYCLDKPRMWESPECYLR
jgi:hypothetical protein